MAKNENLKLYLARRKYLYNKIKNDNPNLSISDIDKKISTIEKDDPGLSKSVSNKDVDYFDTIYGTNKSKYGKNEENGYEDPLNAEGNIRVTEQEQSKAGKAGVKFVPTEKYANLSEIPLVNTSLLTNRSASNPSLFSNRLNVANDYYGNLGEAGEINTNLIVNPEENLMGNKNPKITPKADLVERSNNLKKLESKKGEYSGLSGSELINSRTLFDAKSLGAVDPTGDYSLIDGKPKATVDPYDKSLDEATKIGQGIEMAKLGTNLMRMARNNATEAPEDILPANTPLLNYRALNPDYSNIDNDLGRSISQMRAMGLGSSHINSLLRSGSDAKRKLTMGINEANIQGRNQINSINANITANNNSQLYNARRQNEARDMQLAAMKGKANDSLFSSVFDNATNMYNYKVDNANKRAAREQYDRYMLSQEAKTAASF